MTPHVRQHKLSEAGKPEEIDLQLAARLLQRHVLHGSEMTITGVVDKYVYASFGLNDGLHGRGTGHVIGDVELEGTYALTSKSFKELETASSSINAVSLVGKAQGCLTTDAAAGPCEEDDFLLHDGCSFGFRVRR